MSSTRLWVLLLTGVSFLAGLAAGILIAPGMTPPLSHGPFAAYELHFAATFELSAEERSNLRHVLDRYQRELQELEARRAHETETERVKIGIACRERIRKYVLSTSDPARLERFDRQSEGRPAVAPSAIAQ